MTETVSKQLQDIVDSVARNGALTPDAIRQFDELRNRCQLLDANLTGVTAERDSARRDRDANSKEVARLTASLDEANKKVVQLEALRANAEKSVWVAQFEAERRQEMRGILGDVFRNTEIQRTLTNQVSHSQPGGYQGAPPIISYATDTKSETETRK